MKYKAIVFDYGGVLVLNGLTNRAGMMQQIADLLNIKLDELKAEYYKHNYLTNVESQPWVEACLAAVRKFDDSEEVENKVRVITKEFNDSKRINRELLDYLPKLKAAGYVVAILSNYTSELRTILSENGIGEHFVHVFVSGEIGYQKPHPEAFKAVTDGLGIEPNEMIFIDDTPHSLETAEEIGYTPIQFSDNKQLFVELERLGVLPN